MSTSNDENQKYIDLAKKLNILANKGVAEGERYSAKLALDKLMEKYSISMDDIEEEKLDLIEFYCPSRYKWLFFQISSTVIGRKRKCWTSRHNSSRQYLEITKIEELEIRAKWNFYRKAYDNQTKLFNHAFIITNNLYPLDDGGLEEPKKERTPEQMANDARAALIASRMEKSEYLMQLDH